MLRLALLLIFGLGLLQCQDKTHEKPAPHIVFIMGDEEYRSEESMPMMAKIAKHLLDAKVSLCYSVDSAGFIDPNRSDHIQGLEALESADLMVMFTRFRALPKDELKMISDYVESGRPMVGFRTSTHAFLYKEDSTMFHMNNEWPTKVFGQQWITHHGHFDDGHGVLTEVEPLKGSSHAILTGVQSFGASSWLYHVDGGDWKLFGDSQPLVMGRPTQSNHEKNGNLDKFQMTNPVAWTKSYTGQSGKTARVFFTTLGHPYDFKEESMRRLSMQGIYWALGLESTIPKEGLEVPLRGMYAPNNSGFGQKFKKNQKPQIIE